MSDSMRAIDFGRLIDWSLREYKRRGCVFGLDEAHFYRNGREKRYHTIWGEAITTPVGPAAGPHAQLAQNILTAYLAGARFIELKTVQKMDGEEIRLAVKKPCILAEDEGYNCEWSTELTVEEAFNEYVKAYFAIKVLAVELGISDGQDFAYNMSVGYDLDGIKRPKIDRYIEGLKDAGQTEIFRACHNWLGKNPDRFERFGQTELEAISPRICQSITLSTLHGCPPQEIERIAAYLLTEKHLHTFVKCNPTLLGYSFARETLDRMGYDYIAFSDLHFREDLQFTDAVAMFKRLLPLSAELGLKFGVKLSNTFPVDVDHEQLPSQEMYMSGRSLYALTLNLAARLSEAFDGALPISFSGGADALNVAEILATGVGPVTLATTLLKPGGYGRLCQIARNAENVAREPRQGVDAAALKALAERATTEPRNNKRFREKVRSRKTMSELPLFDCYKAPCKDGGCPINQQIPEYLQLTAEGRYDEAISLITLDNTCPTILGVLCAQPCRDKCTRVDYEQALEMRQVKLLAADQGQKKLIEGIKEAALCSDKKVAIIGAGPAGVAAGLLLRRNGVAADVFEKRDKAYGIVRYIIPEFRISDEQIDRDFALAEAQGVRFHFNADPNYDLNALKKDYDYVLLSTGSWKACQPPVREGGEHVRDALDFLWEARNEGGAKLGKRVAIIGAGDVAMDCARTARRCQGVEQVTIVYRRTETYMPAAQEDVNQAREEGIEIIELLAPVTYDGRTLHCEKMRLGDYEPSGRKACVGTGELVDLQFDDAIGATGARLDSSAYAANGIALDGCGRPALDVSCQTNIPGVYIIGDGRHGPSTIVQAVADAKTAVLDILKREQLSADFARPRYPLDEATLRARRAVLESAHADGSEGRRCLKCDQICEICTEVCPNRANVAVEVPGFENPRQIVHLDGMCNECGNCAVFCPHAGKPYRDKLTLFWTEEDFVGSTNCGLLKLACGVYRYRDPKGVETRISPETPDLEPRLKAVLDVLEKEYPFYFRA